MPSFHSVIEFEVGRVYNRQRDIHDRFGGQAQGGISTPKNYPFIFLFTGESGQSYGYRDGWRDGVFLYTGEGQVGDMTFKGGNKAIRDHGKDGKDLLLFKSLGKGKGYLFLGFFSCSTYEELLGIDRNGKQRKVIVFHLVPVSQPFPQVPLLADEFQDLSLQDIRNLALGVAQEGTTAVMRDARELFRRRSQLIKFYALKRANGECECCQLPAPFRCRDGSPYLEVHHIRRLSDDGPDHPSWVGAICPTCHRRIHYGKDGDELNERLRQRIQAREMQIERGMPQHRRPH